MSNLQTLKRLVREEYSKYLKEQGMDIPMDPMGDMGGPMDDPMVSVSDKDIDLAGGKDENPLDTLKQIFDMLKDFFEGDAAPKGDDKPKKDDKPKGDDKKDKDSLQERFQKLANIIK